MNIIQLHEVGKLYGGRLVFEGLSWRIDERDRVGLVGPNGAGKSTLLRLIAGDEQADAGTVTRRKGLRVAYLPQEVAGDDRSVLATVLAMRPDIAALDRELLAIEAQLSRPEVSGDIDALARVLDRQSAVLEQLDELGGPRVHNEAVGHLRVLGFDADSHAIPTRLLSGGQRKLVMLAGCLLQRPDLLLLDEPDTHVDLAHKSQLEALIRDFDGAVAIISHDRYLLDETVRTIAELEDRRLTLWDGNYSAYAVAKEVAQLRQQELFVTQQKEIARLEAAIARFRVWLNISLDERHKKRILNKQRQIERMDKVERPVLERKKMALELRPGQRGGQKAIELRDVGMAFGDELILLGLSHTFWRGERVGIVGPNGAGKTVLGRLLAGQLEPSYGEVWRGPSVDVGYYAQGHETLDLQSSVLESIRAVKPMYEEQATAFLGRFLFSYAQAQQPVGLLSGGERSRLQLARLMLGGANCLVLDEPTNHLDIASAEVLEAALSDYPGTILVVSHDRYFLDRVVDRVVELRDGGMRCFDGGYSAYLEAGTRLAAERQARAAAEARPRRGVRATG